MPKASAANGKGALGKKLKDIKSKYALATVNQKNPKDDSVEVYVAHAGENNSKNLIEVKLLSKAELDKQFAEAVADLEKMLKTLGHPETGAISESSAKTAAHEIDLAHDVIDGTHVRLEPPRHEWAPIYQRWLADRSKVRVCVTPAGTVFAHGPPPLRKRDAVLKVTALVPRFTYESSTVPSVG